ncbi:MAG: hypothetical protein A2087_14540 [Spirochaetes bacterium GWD1_61_31]|nr:MAG: hypothetical protein A2Y37_11000 [Spirochaetes bacterium GWB1_60_80]OHD33702.1 MAG: hypothetical protein A2004_09690 [Spirochaetes bacterium GWC1_61_12]OHD37304.1 MAG: hypothetical protein A2087_14540 [Spirochaetes bacterium GWD1_61_31]OHD44965.1 MAG: hypothetical protein A2Y35_13045 [Spirochaetes bacterium GWE1_60_18]OHD60074.1 MAG: hypothetical protein A2Y32_11155 [Spirochaetes bacterium GWF1_60_12]HAP43637.1 hypothetical protein [Spirochaetaceae bacterium]
MSIFPHLDYELPPDNAMVHAEKWAAGRTVLAYTTDDQSAIKVSGKKVEFVSMGFGKLFTCWRGMA